LWHRRLAGAARLTLGMASARVVGASVAGSSSFQGCTHPDDHTIINQSSMLAAVIVLGLGALFLLFVLLFSQRASSHLCETLPFGMCCALCSQVTGGQISFGLPKATNRQPVFVTIIPNN